MKRQDSLFSLIMSPMESSGNSYLLLRNLLLASRDPFATETKILDIQHILETSTSFSGMNHLVLAESYLNPNSFPFEVSYGKALAQAKEALREGNRRSYYVLFELYLLGKDERRARGALDAACFYQDTQALVRRAYFEKEGLLYERNRKKAWEDFLLAAKKGSRDGFFGLQLMKSEDGDYEEAKKIYQEGQKRGMRLIGALVG